MELMIVIAILGMLSVIAAGKFTELVAKSKDGYTKGALGNIRSALAVYYADNISYPADDLSSLTADGKYLNILPKAKLPNTGHPDTASVATGASTGSFITDAGGWAYDNNSLDTGWGSINVNCGHKNTKDETWSGQ